MVRPGALEAAAPSPVLTALTQAPIGIAIFDRDMRYLAASSQFLIDQGLPGDTPLVGRLHYDVFPEIPQHWRELHARVLSDGEEQSHEADPYVRGDGRKEWIRWSLAPWRSEAGAIGGLVLYTEVVTPAVEARLRLEAAEARYRAVFDQASVGVALVSPTGRTLELNDRFCAILARDRDTLLGLPFQKITHPDDIAKDLEAAGALLEGREPTYTIEKRYLHDAREPIWVNLTVSLVRDASGEPEYFVAVIEDIADRKAAQVQQLRYQSQLRLLINELNHRVKNTLATVQSLAAQTLRGQNNPASAYERFEARLMGLAEVHDVLTRESWHGAALRDVAERAIAPFSAAASGKVRIDGPPVWLLPTSALTMALVFHELATNAVKYGALSAEAGRVDLAWTFDPESDRLRLTWTEHGGPPVAPPTRKGFGSRLIARAMKGELRGSSAVAYAPAGLTCVLEAQLPQPTGPLEIGD